MDSGEKGLRAATELYHALRRVPFDDHPWADVKDRLALLTLPAGQRSVAAFGFGRGQNEDALLQLRAELRSCGLRTLLTDPLHFPPARMPWDMPGSLCEVLDRVTDKTERTHQCRLLWVFSGDGDREKIQNLLTDGFEAGNLLGYPSCCVQQEKLAIARYWRGCATPAIETAEGNPQAIERALQAQPKSGLAECGIDLRLPAWRRECQNSRKTVERFPFVLHTACGSCLEQRNSPSAELNQRYERLARHVNPGFHRAVLEITGRWATILSIVQAAERHAYPPGWLAPSEHDYAAHLFRQIGRIHAESFKCGNSR